MLSNSFRECALRYINMEKEKTTPVKSEGYM